MVSFFWRFQGRVGQLHALGSVVSQDSMMGAHEDEVVIWRSQEANRGISVPIPYISLKAMPQ